MITLTLFAGARATRPSAVVEFGWLEFCADVACRCAAESTATDKRDLPAYGPYRLRDGTTRSAANVESMSRVVGLDVDDCDLEALRARITELKLAAIVHGSPSDDPAGTRKVRVYVHADREHAPSEAGAVRRATAQLLGVRNDPSTGNADRILFVGRLAGTEARYVERFDGSPLLLADLDLGVVTVPDTTPTPAPERDRPAYDAAKYAILGALGPWQDYDGRKNSVCLALGGMLRKMDGWSRADAEDLVRNWLPAGVAGVDVDAGVRTATKAWDRAPEECSGRMGLDAVVGERTGAVIEQALFLPLHSAQVEAPAPTAAPDADPFGIAVDWGNDVEIPLRYLCEGLCLVPSDGKIAAVFGQPGAGKGPLADHMAACFALGEPILGQFACIRQRVLLLCFESARLTERRLRRMARAMGHAPRELMQQLWLYDCRAVLDPCAPGFIELVRRTCVERSIGVIVLDSYTSATMSSGIDYMRPEYALLAKALGSIDSVLTIAVAHGNKAGAESATPRIKDLAYSGAFASLIETGIAVSKPESDDGTLIRVCCARAPETGFAPFHARFADVEGDGLAVTVDANASTGRERGANLNSGNVARADDKAARTLLAGKRIMASLTSDQCVKRAELRARGGAGVNAADAALAALVSAKLLTLIAGAYQLTPAGVAADEGAIDTALGRVGSFTRGV